MECTSELCPRRLPVAICREPAILCLAPLSLAGHGITASHLGRDRKTFSAPPRSLISGWQAEAQIQIAQNEESSEILNQLK